MCSEKAWAACEQGDCVRQNEYFWQCLPAGTKVVGGKQQQPGKQAAAGKKPATRAAIATAGVWPPEQQAEVSRDARVAQLEMWAEKLSRQSSQQ